MVSRAKGLDADQPVLAIVLGSAVALHLVLTFVLGWLRRALGMPGAVVALGITVAEASAALAGTNGSDRVTLARRCSTLRSPDSSG